MGGADAAVDDVRVHPRAAAVGRGGQARDAVEGQEGLVQAVEVPRHRLVGDTCLRADGSVGFEHRARQASRQRRDPGAGDGVDDHAADAERPAAEHASADAPDSARARHLPRPTQERAREEVGLGAGGVRRRLQRRAQVLRVGVVVVERDDVSQAALVVVVVVVVETDDVVRARARRDREEEGGEGDDEETPRHGCARDAPEGSLGATARARAVLGSLGATARAVSTPARVTRERRRRAVNGGGRRLCEQGKLDCKGFMLS